MEGTASNPGVLPLAIRYVFEQLKKKQASTVLMRCSYIEIKNCHRAILFWSKKQKK
jgi:hypothetical protein